MTRSCFAYKALNGPSPFLEERVELVDATEITRLPRGEEHDIRELRKCLERRLVDRGDDDHTFRFGEAANGCHNFARGSAVQLVDTLANLSR